MNGLERVLRRMRRLWVLEHSARGGLLTLALAVDACLLCLLLRRLVGLPLAAMAAVAAAAVALVAALAAVAWARAPRRARLAQLADERAGTDDLFASALEFAGQPERFGWLGGMTCELAHRRAAEAALRPRWSFGPVRHWVAAGAVALALAGACGGVWLVQAFSGGQAGPDVATTDPPRGPAARPSASDW